MSLFPYTEGEKRVELRGSDYDHDGFEAFWRVYPRREARKDAVKAWNQLRLEKDVQGLILEALEWQVGLRNWQEAKRFIPLPASYLRGARWTDEKRDSAPNIPAHRLTPFEQARRAGLK